MTTVQLLALVDAGCLASAVVAGVAGVWLVWTGRRTFRHRSHGARLDGPGRVDVDVEVDVQGNDAGRSHGAPASSRGNAWRNVPAGVRRRRRDPAGRRPFVSRPTPPVWTQTPRGRTPSAWHTIRPAAGLFVFVRVGDVWEMATGRRRRVSRLTSLTTAAGRRPTPETRYVPTPHIVNGINYEVVDSPTAYMGRGEKPVMASPHAPADVGRILALHEEAHDKFTPNMTPADCVGQLLARHGNPADAALCNVIRRPTAADVVNVCEDTRVNAKLKEYLDVDAAAWAPVDAYYSRLGHSRALRHIKESVAECRKAKDAVSALLTLLPLRSRPGADASRDPAAFVRRYAPTSDASERILLTRAVQVQRRLTDPHASFAETMDAADALLRLAHGLETHWKREAEIDEPGTTPGEFGELADADKETEREAERDVMRSKRGNNWAPMTIETPERPLRIPTPRFRSRMRATDAGSVFRYPQRYTIDGSVFSTRRRMPGGTLLVDVSGSMSLSAEQIDAIVSAAPLATVAIYSGESRRGILRIVAANGTRMRADDMKDGMGGGNVVDGPALQWLVKQPEPRVWICDGAVTGLGDLSCPYLTAEAFATARRGRVVRVPTAADAILEMSTPRKLLAYIKARFRRPE